KPGGILDGLESRCDGRPLLVPEVGVCGAGSQNQVIVLEVAAFKVNEPIRDVDSVHLRKHDLTVRLPPQHRPDRRADVGRRQRGRRHLIQKRLKNVVVSPVEERYLDGRFCQRLRRFESRKSTANYKNPGKGSSAHISSSCLRSRHSRTSATSKEGRTFPLNGVPYRSIQKRVAQLDLEDVRRVDVEG